MEYMLKYFGFVSNWLFFDYCTPDTNKSKVSISFEYLSECSLGFFSKYLKSESALFDNRILAKPEPEYIEPVDYNYSAITTLCNTLLDNDMDYAANIVENNKRVLFDGASQLGLLGRMFSDKEISNWLYTQNAKEIKSFDYYKDMIRDLCFSKDNSMIASASRDNTIKINKLSTGEIIAIKNDYEPNIEEYYRNTYFSSISFVPDNKQLVFTLAGRNEIFFWDINTNTLSEKIVRPGYKKASVSFKRSFRICGESLFQ